MNLGLRSSSFHFASQYHINVMTVTSNHSISGTHTTPIIGARLLIFDLAHILVKKQGKGKMSIRPHVVTFLREILDDEYDYTVAVWSSMTVANVNQALNSLLTIEERNKLLFVWSQDECTSIADFKQTRDLRRVWHHYPHYDSTNTTIFVDKEYKVMEPHQQCSVILPEYDGPRLAKDDNVFCRLKAQLDNRFLI